MTGTWKGLQAQEVDAGGLVALVVPELGGKIVSLHTDDGAELLVNRDLTADRPAPGARFVDVAMGGWDECVPTIDECLTSDGVVLPDHGEAWRLPWEDEGEGWYGYAGRVAPYEFSRRVWGHEGRLRFDYLARATGHSDVAMLWAAHPQFAAPRGTRVHLAATVSYVVDVLAEPPRRRPWPVGGMGIDDVPMPGSGQLGCCKVYVEPDSPVDRAAVVRPDGLSIQMSWEPRLTPYLGIWMERGVFASEPVVAVEPTTGFYDSCSFAAARGQLTVLEPGEELTWYVDLEVHQ